MQSATPQFCRARGAGTERSMRGPSLPREDWAECALGRVRRSSNLLRQLHARDQTLPDASKVLPRRAWPDDVAPRHGALALMQHHGLPPASSGLRIITGTICAIQSPLPRHILPSRDRVLDTRHNHPSTINLAVSNVRQPPPKAILRPFRKNLRPVRRRRIARRRERKAAAGVPGHVLAVPQEVDGGLGAFAD